VKASLVARNYAEALLATAEKAKAVERFGELLDALAGATDADPTLKAVMMSPRVPKAAKQQLLARALKTVAPDTFVRFLHAVVQRGRQGLLGSMSEAYQELADRHFNRVHASVTTARTPDAALTKIITERLTKAMGMTVVPHFRTEPALLGGVVVRVGDRAFDGSVRRRILLLKQRMLRAGTAKP
jgi:F-type H+-transporting ATPase subunit delta